MKTIVEVLAHSVECYAARPALLQPTDDGQGITTINYRSFQTKAQQFGGYLQKQGYKKGDRLLIWCASRSEWMIAYMGALLVGIVVVPLDVASKQDFLERVAAATHANTLITTQKQYRTLKDTRLSLLDIDALPTDTFDPQAAPDLAGDDLAQVVFTSGTTGTPKGVMLSHANIVSNVEAAAAVVDIRATDRALSVLPLSHMFELTVEVALLYCGSSILYARTLAPDVLLKLLASQDITCMALVPQALQLFMNNIERQVRAQKRERQWEQLHRISHYIPFGLRQLPFRAVHQRFGKKFRFFFAGGAYLPPTLAQKWLNMGFTIVQGYGATECSPIVTATPRHSHNLASIGKPLPGVSVRIADDKEILAHGPNISPGYLDNPEATAAAFENGWYHTGDLGEIDAQGYVYLRGRKKNIIVLANGLNVYPEDIENILNSSPGVKDAVVVGLDKADQGPEVHAILLMEEPEKAKAIVQAANKKLAAHQQIRGFTLWPDADFPRTHTLKVKRQDVMAMLPAMQKK